MNSKTEEKIDWKLEAARFDGVADLYERYRPGYPVALIDTLVEISGLQPGNRLLEVGSGTGKATRMLAGRGYSILCIEPGRNLAALAAQTLKAFPEVSFDTVPFEEWRVQPGVFDLVYSAQAWHWVPQPLGFSRAAQALKDNAYLGLFWNMYPQLRGAVYEGIQAVYQRLAPELAASREPLESLAAQREAAILESGCFDRLRTCRYAGTAWYDIEHYLGFLSTTSDHLRLTDHRRLQLFAAIAEVIAAHGGVIEKPYLAVLYVAQKKSQPTA